MNDNLTPVQREQWRALLKPIFFAMFEGNYRECRIIRDGANVVFQIFPELPPSGNGEPRIIT